jgi:hypothetical protein
LERQRLAVQSGPTDKARAEGEKLLDEHAELQASVPGIARGNPGLQDLIGRKLVLSRVVTPEHAGKVLVEMEAQLAQGELPSDTEAREFLEILAIDRLIALAGEPRARAVAPPDAVPSAGARGRRGADSRFARPPARS